MAEPEDSCDAHEMDRLREMARRAHHDATTGLLSTSEVLLVLAMEYERARRYGEALTLLCITIDAPAANEPEMERRIAKAAKTVRSLLRASDVAGRLSQNELIVLLVVPAAEGGRRPAERILEAFRAKRDDDRARISIGITEFDNADPPELDEFIGRAQQAAYRARAAGGDAIVTWTP